MVIKTSQLVIPVPRAKTFKYTISIAGTDVTGRVQEARFRKPITTSIGDFFIRLINTG